MPPMLLAAESTSFPNGECRLLGQIFRQRLANSVDSGAAHLSLGERAALISRFTELVRQLSALLRVTASDGTRPTLQQTLLSLMHLVSRALDADRSSLFLYDNESDELFSQVAEGPLSGEIRFSAHRGIAGRVLHTGEPLLIDDAYGDPRFNPDIDEQTGYRTRNILCVPLRNWDGQVIGVTEALNKRHGSFTAEDLALLDALTSHAAAALEGIRLYEGIQRALYDEAQLLGVTAALTSELQLDVLLVKIMQITTKVLDADRSTLLLYDETTRELCSKIAQGLEGQEIRIGADCGIAGFVFTTGKTVNIPDAYADPRFNPEVDRTTGYATRSILCVPVVTHSAQIIGIIQVLNKRGGPFRERDENRLRALASQAAVAIENARLFEAMLNARNYGESVLRSLSNGVITLDSRRRIIKANPAALRILGLPPEQVRGRTCEEVFGPANSWVPDLLTQVEQQQRRQIAPGGDLRIVDGTVIPINLMVEPLIDIRDHPIGWILIMEDVTEEKRVRTTMARYMSREVAERLLTDHEAILGGQAQEVTVLFSDIQGFTGLTEHLGAQATVAMLNEYFGEMADLVLQHGGILDKYIGDAIMALFGTPFPGPEDADQAVRAAVDMTCALERLNGQRRRRGAEPIAIRVGINTGEVIVGNIGSARRMDYTAIGHTVNVAARVESANRHYGSQILVTGSTVRQLARPWRVREIDCVRMNGSAPESLYEVLDGVPGRDIANVEGLIAAFTEGVRRYRARNWSAATGAFRAALDLRPGDGPSHLYLERCAHYQSHPPSHDWDGVWSLVGK
jgi:adenylate cyclase